MIWTKIKEIKKYIGLCMGKGTLTGALSIAKIPAVTMDALKNIEGT
jgi:hypothetical protein